MALGLSWQHLGDPRASTLAMSMVWRLDSGGAAELPGTRKYPLISHGRKIAVIGLGYVGLPVAAAFARVGTPVVDFDIDQTRIQEFRAGEDRTREVEASDLKFPSLRFTSEAGVIQASDFFIVRVP